MLSEVNGATKRAATLLIVMLFSSMAATGCGGGTGGIETSGVWARSTPGNAANGATYMQLTAEEDDRLVGVSISADVAGRAEVHEVVAVESGEGAMSDGEMSDGEMDDDEMSDGEMGHGDNPMMAMRELENGLELAAGKTVIFEPGGYHFMLLDLVSPLEVGDEFELELQFENSDPLVVAVEVRDEAP